MVIKVEKNKHHNCRKSASIHHKLNKKVKIYKNMNRKLVNSIHEVPAVTTMYCFLGPVLAVDHPSMTVVPHRQEK